MWPAPTWNSDSSPIHGFLTSEQQCTALESFPPIKSKSSNTLNWSTCKRILTIILFLILILDQSLTLVSHILSSPSWVVANIFSDSLFHLTWYAPATTSLNSHCYIFFPKHSHPFNGTHSLYRLFYNDINIKYIFYKSSIIITLQTVVHNIMHVIYVKYT